MLNYFAQTNLASYNKYFTREIRAMVSFEPHHEKIWSWENLLFAYAKTKAQIRCTLTAQLISAFVFAT